MGSRIMRTASAAVAATAMALALSGCGLGEKLLEEGAERLTGAEIDVGDEGISFESDEGSFSANAEGDVNIETEDGTFTSGAELPDDFPSSVPLPDGGQLANAARIDTEDGLGWMVNVQYDSGNPSDALQAQIDALTAAGFSPPEDGEGAFHMGDGDTGMGGQMLEDATHSVIVSTIGEPGEFVLGLQVFEQPPE